jgi:hypothetical protein
VVSPAKAHRRFPVAGRSEPDVGAMESPNLAHPEMVQKIVTAVSTAAPHFSNVTATELDPRDLLTINRKLVQRVKHLYAVVERLRGQVAQLNVAQEKMHELQQQLDLIVNSSGEHRRSGIRKTKR